MGPWKKSKKRKKDYKGGGSKKVDKLACYAPFKRSPVAEWLSEWFLSFWAWVQAPQGDFFFFFLF